MRRQNRLFAVPGVKGIVTLKAAMSEMGAAGGGTAAKALVLHMAHHASEAAIVISAVSSGCMLGRLR